MQQLSLALGRGTECPRVARRLCVVHTLVLALLMVAVERVDDAPLSDDEELPAD